MKVKSIYIKNFLGINELRLDFKGVGGNTLDLIALAGPNGCGKTTVMEACLLLLGKKDLIQSKRFDSDQFKESEQDFFISCYIEHYEKEFELQLSPEMKTPTIPLGLDQVPIEYFSSWRYPKLVGAIPVTVGKKGKRHYDNEENRLRLLKQYLVNLTASKAFESKQKQLTFFEEEQTAYDKLNRVWKYFYPSRNEQFIARRVGEDISEGFDIFLEGRREYPIPIDALSSGEIEILTFIGQTIRNPFKGGVIFIDEPELHLHTSWHRAILSALRDMTPDTQIICATHSLEVLDSIYSYERFTLLPEDDPRIRLDQSKFVEPEIEDGIAV